MIALSNRLPVSTLNPARRASGASKGQITSGRATSLPAQSSASVRPVTVGGSSINPRSASSETTAGTPPAWWKSSPRNSPAGCMLTTSGRPWPCLSQSDKGRSTPSVSAMAARWIGALVDPPISVLTRIAFRKAARVMISDGFRSSATISTIRPPVRQAISAGRDAGPGWRRSRAIACPKPRPANSSSWPCPSCCNSPWMGRRRRPAG